MRHPSIKKTFCENQMQSSMRLQTIITCQMMDIWLNAASSWDKNAQMHENQDRVKQKTYIFVYNSSNNPLHFIIITTKMHRSENIQRIYGCFTFAIVFLFFFLVCVSSLHFLWRYTLRVLLPFVCE